VNQYVKRQDTRGILPFFRPNLSGACASVVVCRAPVVGGALLRGVA
jgi:hypothetical protein